MQKIISLFKRNYEGDRQVYDEIVPGAEWVVAGEGVATEKYDGTCCLIQDGKLFKRYDRKMTRLAWKRKKCGHEGPWTLEDYKVPPDSWVAAEPEPNHNTGHWPGWVPVGDEPESKWHREAWESCRGLLDGNGTYELVGPKVNSNPYSLEFHYFWKHGMHKFDGATEPPRDFNGLREWLRNIVIEGIVWHHPDGRMVKIKRRDFGHKWPDP